MFSRASEEEAQWVRHAEGRVGPGASVEEEGLRATDPERLRQGLSGVPAPEFYRHLAAAGIQCGPAFQGLTGLWSGEGEALGEMRLPEAPGKRATRRPRPCWTRVSRCLPGMDFADRSGRRSLWLPVGWDRLWLAGPLLRHLLCHVRSRPVEDERPDVRRADLWLYAPDGGPLGRLEGFTVKRASRAALLATAERVEDLLYEQVWREVPNDGDRGLSSAIFLGSPGALASGAREIVGSHAVAEGLDLAGMAALGEDLETLARAYAFRALKDLGWERRAGVRVQLEELRRQLKIVEEHRGLLRRLLGMLEDGGLLVSDEGSGEWLVVAGAEDPLPATLDAAADLLEGADGVVARHPAGKVEFGLLRRCGEALTGVLRGRADTLELLFGGEPSAADLYRDAPGSRLLNRLVADVVSRAVSELPEGRRLRVVEVGAGTGGTTGAVLAALPAGRVDYLYTDISAGFFSEAEERFGDFRVRMEYRALDIERDPAEQGFEFHRADLVLAANVLHATRDLGESLSHCRRLLAESGVLVVLEGMQAQGWLDLTFGLLPGWWRFADAYRTEHALVGPAVWRRALSDAGYEDVEIVGSAEPEEGESPAGEEVLSTGLIVARGPAEVRADPGVWVVWPADGEGAVDLVRELTEQNQRVVLPGAVEAGQRDSWRSFFAGLSEELSEEGPLSGVVHLGGSSGHGVEATGEELAGDVARIGSSALALTQGVQDAGVTPSSGLWFVTRGAQVIGEECGGELSGSVLWGFGRTGGAGDAGAWGPVGGSARGGAARGAGACRGTPVSGP